MVTCTKGNGLTTKHKDKGATHTQMVLTTKVNGLKTNSMDMVLSPGQMGRVTRETTNKERNKDVDDLLLLTAATTRVSS